MIVGAVNEYREAIIGLVIQGLHKLPEQKLPT
jgi:hypothetical protein